MARNTLAQEPPRLTLSDLRKTLSDGKHNSMNNSTIGTPQRMQTRYSPLSLLRQERTCHNCIQLALLR
eukprot:2788423-Amphidinium_carterae.4